MMAAFDMGFDMGVYAPYVWGSYGVAATLLIGLAWTSWRRARALAARLAELEATAPHRRRRAEMEGRAGTEGTDGA